MISGRCSLLSTVRCISELSKKRCSIGAHEYCKNSYLAESALVVERQSNRSNHTSAFLLSSSVKMASTSRGSDKSTDHSDAKKNRLSLEKSPYLLQHATNPVQWYPWGDEALERAKKENKIIFVSIGYSTCHWCHVMEKESFVNEQIAKVMNEYYINIKVDREERPDIDMMCMSFIQRLTGQGGWPLSVFLTPDLMPITGGTYFTQPMFLLHLTRIAKEWTEHRDKLVKSATVIAERMRKLTESRHDIKDDGVPTVDCALLCAHMLMNMYDSTHGGFGNSDFVMKINSPKFPEPSNLNFLLSIHILSTSDMLNEQALEACLHTLRKMAYGGIHDHVGQGFHRYSVNSQWTVPHFEKMLYDQAQLIQCYADAYTVTKDTFFSDIVDDIATYVIRDLRHKEGGFYSAEDADSLSLPHATEKQEGAYYVWSYDKLKDLLGKKVPGKDNVTYFDLICQHFSVQKAGNVEKQQDPHGELTGKNVFSSLGMKHTAKHFNFTEEETQKYVNEACQILFEERSKRPRPSLDDKIVTAWNGLMISGFARAGIAVKNEYYVELAKDAARFVERYLFDEKKRVLLRSCYRKDDRIVQGNVPIHGFHDDYAFLVKGLLDLYDATFDPHWIEFAEELQNIQDRLFWDSQDGGYFATAEDSPILSRMKDSNDGAEPSGNSVACSNMLRLAIYLDRDELRRNAEKLLCAFGNKLTNCPAACPQMTLALIEYHHPTQIYVAGKENAKETIEMLNVIRERLIPGRVLILADPEQQDNVLFRKNLVVSKMKPQKNQATVFVCRGFSCSLPVSNTSHLITVLERKGFANL